MKNCIFIGTRLEAFKTVNQFFKVNLIVTAKNSFVHKYYKKKVRKIIIRKTNKKKIFKIIADKKTFLLFSAGFPFIVPKYVFRNKKILLNSHPSILPKFKGLKPIDEIFKKGERKFGVTIHEIDEKVDSGKIFGQIQKIYKTSDLNKIKQNIFSKLEPKLINKVLKKLTYEK